MDSTKTLGALVTEILTRLGEAGLTPVWTPDEITEYIRTGYRELALLTRVFWDQLYSENLPAGFSYTAAWEEPYLLFNFGLANFTLEAERRLFEPEADAIGPANYTSPFEGTSGYLTRAGADTSIPATSELPESLNEVDRGVWDGATIDAYLPQQIMRHDSRYEVTQGEVYGYMWRKDGIRTFRKVRVPSAQADTHTITGSWGVLRVPIDISAETVTGSFGIPRRLPTMHPMGPSYWGLPRRPYREGKNVRIEHWRQGRELDSALTITELPDRYAVYLRDYAQAKAYGRAGPGQDNDLAAHYESRWQRHVLRLQRRTARVDQARTGQFGPVHAVAAWPPRPKLPWNYPQRTR